MGKRKVSIAHYLPVPLAHGHGYGYLKTKDVSGAALQGASDGVFVTRRRGNLNERKGNWKKEGVIGKH